MSVTGLLARTPRAWIQLRDARRGIMARWSHRRAASPYSADARSNVAANPQRADCLFCLKYNSHQNNIMYENKSCYVRYDNFPAMPGHVEIVTKRHVASFFELTGTELDEAFQLLLRAKMQLAAKYQPDGYTIGVNEGEAAGRSIDHLHIHLIPRHFGDVPDPRGGIRQIVPNCDPDLWVSNNSALEISAFSG